MTDITSIIVESIFDGLAVVNFKGDIVFTNGALANLTEYSTSGLIDLHLSKIVKDKQLVAHLIKKARKNQEIAHLKVSILPNHSPEFPMELSSRRLLDDERILIVFRDLQCEMIPDQETIGFKQIKLEEIFLSLFKQGSKGPELVAMEPLPFVKGNQSKFAAKIGVFYLAALGQGSIFNTGLFGPLPLPTISNYEALAYAFFANDPTDQDLRTAGNIYSIIVMVVPKAQTENFCHRKAVERIFDDEISKISCIQEITLTRLKNIKERLQARFREENYEKGVAIRSKGGMLSIG
ncbi:MAG: PAS domain-containing protein [Candidatus Hodarchaeales archaeon]|jgi:hypothetical protein